MLKNGPSDHYHMSLEFEFSLYSFEFLWFKSVCCWSIYVSQSLAQFNITLVEDLQKWPKSHMR
jgi:hypothetical protein